MLSIHRLSAFGWMSYAKLDVYLNSDGITYIQGKVGSGKSAILEAIFYLLTGQVSRKKSAIKDFENQILNVGYDICLEFSVSGRRAVIREIRDRSVSETMFGKELEAGLYFFVADPSGAMISKRGNSSAETRTKISNFVNMSIYDLCSMAIIMQRQRQDLVEGTAGKRAAALVELFSLEKYDILISRCLRDIKESSSEHKGLSDRRDLYSAELVSLRDQLTLAPPDGYNEAELNAITTKIVDTRDRLEKLRSTKDSIFNDIKSHKAAQSSREKRRKLEQELDKLETEFKSIDLDLKSDIDTVLRSKRTKLAELEGTISGLMSDIGKIKKNPDNCPITKNACPVGVPKQYKDERITKLQEDLQTQEAVVGPLKGEVSALACSCTVLDSKKNLDREIRAKRGALSAVGLSDMRDLDVAEHEQKADKCEETIQKGNQYLVGKEREKDVLIEARGKLAEFTRGQQSAEKALAARESDLVLISTELDKVSVRNKYLNATRSVFERARLIKIDLVTELLNESVEDILYRISDGELSAKFVSAKLDSSGKKILDKMDIIVADCNKTLPIGMWSGGQITQVGLAILLSVFKTARKISGKATNFVWLDEPFGPLDNDLVDKVFGAIRDLGEDLDASSIKIISHRDLDARVWDNKWTITIEDGISKLHRSDE